MKKASAASCASLIVNLRSSTFICASLAYFITEARVIPCSRSVDRSRVTMVPSLVTIQALFEVPSVT